MVLFIPLAIAVFFVVVGVYYLLAWLLSDRARHAPGGLTIGVVFTVLGALIIWAYVAWLGG